MNIAEIIGRILIGTFGMFMIGGTFIWLSETEIGRALIAIMSMLVVIVMIIVLGFGW